MDWEKQRSRLVCNPDGLKKAVVEDADQTVWKVSSWWFLTLIS